MTRMLDSHPRVPSLLPKVQFYDLHPPLEDFRAEVLRGLTHSPKKLSPKFLYDKSGAELFDAICALEEYYLTRTEMAILRTQAGAIAQLIGDGALIEFGSGSSQKIRILLDAAPQLQTYVALDISKQHLLDSCLQLVGEYPDLEAIAICTDYTQPLELPDLPSLADKHRVGFFPGSTIGNLEPQEAIAFLKNVAQVLQPKGSLLIGVDLKKAASILEPAYDDAQGVSAAFALNVLTRINRELDADFDRSQFTYQAVYNPIGRIEMYIVSQCDQTVQVGDVTIAFRAGERLRTEYSYKYSVEEFQAIAHQAGYIPQTVWTDPQTLFSIHYLNLP